MLSEMGSIWAGQSTGAWRPLTGTNKALLIPSGSALSVRSGILTTPVLNVRAHEPVCGAVKTIFTRSVLILKAKIGQIQNVQTAMRHIRHGQKAVQPSLQPPKTHLK